MDAPQPSTPTPSSTGYAPDNEISLADIILFVSKYCPLPEMIDAKVY